MKRFAFVAAALLLVAGTKLHAATETDMDPITAMRSATGTLRSACWIVATRLRWNAALIASSTSPACNP